MNTLKENKIQIDLSIEEINTVLTGLGNLPYANVYELIGKIREQTETQLKKNTKVLSDQIN